MVVASKVACELYCYSGLCESIILMDSAQEFLGNTFAAICTSILFHQQDC